MTGRPIDVNFYLEMINGTGAILLVIVLAFFTVYLIEQRRFRKLSWRETIFRPPPGISLLMPMMAIKIGLLLSRGSLWMWRQLANGGHMPAWQLDLALGEGPWIASAGLVLLYVGANSLGLIP
jgi:hypothetical protein